MKRARRTILFVEDEEDIRLPVGRFFESNDFDVIEADTCATGLEAFRRSRPDVTVIDYSLPDGDGLTLVRAFRETDPGIPIVILTGHGTIDLAVQAIKQGAEQFLTKPVELPVLLAIVNRLIESSTNQRFRLAQESRETRALDPFFGESPA
ncbi:MAG: response regulator, partial [Acidobacteria bacterium]|nr:response regulator [Acidobacteriota bacterium]